VPTILFNGWSRCSSIQSWFLSVLQSVLLHRPFGVSEDRTQYQFLSCDQVIDIRLGIMIERGPALRVPHAGKRETYAGSGIVSIRPSKNP
jgi:hypothetical protein